MHLKFGDSVPKICGSHSRAFEMFHLLGYNTMWSVEILPIFRRGTCRLDLQRRIISEAGIRYACYLIYALALEKKAACSTDTFTVLYTKV
jgi:hypothetical protein